MFPITTKLAGVSHGACQHNIKTYGGEGVGNYQLVREPGNPHDPNAIMVALFGHYGLGYVPAAIAKKIAPIIDSGRHLEAEFVSVNRHPYHEQVGITVRVVEITH